MIIFGKIIRGLPHGKVKNVFLIIKPLEQLACLLLTKNLKPF
jgi:hypothetical protein